MRPIDADTLVKWLYKQTEGAIAMEDHVPEQFKEYYRGKMEAFIEVSCHVRRHTPTLELYPRQQWISVKDRYPKDQQHVLIAYKDSDYVSIGYFDEGFAEWDSLYDNEIVRPDYWMPLPEPPKEENNHDD